VERGVHRFQFDGAPQRGEPCVAFTALDQRQAEQVLPTGMSGIDGDDPFAQLARAREFAAPVHGLGFSDQRRQRSDGLGARVPSGFPARFAHAHLKSMNANPDSSARATVNVDGAIR